MTLIANLDGNFSILDNISSEVTLIDVPIERNIRFYSDFKALLILISLFKKNGYLLVHSISPKAGLLSAIAAWISKIPNRLHTFTGQIWVTKRGLNRWFFKSLDRIIVLLNTRILVDSFSQQDFLIKESVLSTKNSVVLGRGSISGVDSMRFFPSKKYKDFIRNELKIKNESIIFLFLGRLKKEKGILELIEAFNKVNKIHTNTVLLIVGPDEENLKSTIMNNYRNTADVIKFVEFTSAPEKYMAASDVFVLPSYREGFGTVVIEAASCGLPGICSNIYGLTDAIKDKETGILIPVRSSKSIEDAMLKLLKNDKLRHEMGISARNRAINHFSQNNITLEITKLYKRFLIDEKSI